MDAVRIDVKKKTEPERLALCWWLKQNGRVATSGDWTALQGSIDGDPTETAIVRDVDARRVHYAAFVHEGTEEPRLERRFVQLEAAPLPFPAELGRWRVDV